MLPRIPLYELGGLGLILSMPTGVRYSNQTGGTNCLQPELEGALLPLIDESDPGVGGEGPVDRLLGWFLSDKHGGAGATLGLDDADADFIDDTLARSGFAHAIRVDRSRLRESHEAWVWVSVREHERETQYLIEGLGEGTGVITWPNSD